MAMERKIVFAEEVEIFLEELLIILFEKGYFSFPDNAKSYVDSLVDYVEQYIGLLSGKKAPPYFDRYALNMRYIAYRANKKTVWYVFYQQRDNCFLIRYITNNHAAAQHFEF